MTPDWLADPDVSKRDAGVSAGSFEDLLAAFMEWRRKTSGITELPGTNIRVALRFMYSVIPDPKMWRGQQGSRVVAPSEKTGTQIENDSVIDADVSKRDAVRERGDIPAVLRSCARTIKENRLNWFGAAEYLFKYAETVEHQQGSRVVAPSEKTGTQIFEEIQALLDQWRARDLMRRTDREQKA